MAGLYTGDIARMDEEGYFYLVDRKKELIKPGGYQVWPREVEEVIAAQPTSDGSGCCGHTGSISRRNRESLGGTQARREAQRSMM